MATSRMRKRISDIEIAFPASHHLKLVLLFQEIGEGQTPTWPVSWTVGLTGLQQRP
jgi:hypothetical protein